MYTATLCNCICKAAQAREAERLYCQAMDDHFGSAQATLAASSMRHLTAAWMRPNGRGPIMRLGALPWLALANIRLAPTLNWMLNE